MRLIDSNSDYESQSKKESSQKQPQELLNSPRNNDRRTVVKNSKQKLDPALCELLSESEDEESDESTPGTLIML